MLRRFALLLCALSIALLGWLSASDSGLQALLRVASSATGKRLLIEEAHGRLIGPLDIATLHWQDGDLKIAASGIHLDWSASALLRGTLAIAELRADALHIDKPPSNDPASVPADLQVPLSVSAAKLILGEVVYNGKSVASRIVGSLQSDDRQHRLDPLTLQTADIVVAGNLALDGQAPFPLSAALDLNGQLDQRPLALSVAAKGQLERIELAVVATKGVDGHATATVTPFATAPFSTARLQLDHLDPASWLAGAPQADFSLVADFEPTPNGILGSFGLTNHQPGPIDKQKLPLVTLAGTADWQDAGTQLDNLHAVLSGNGTLAGRGAWRGEVLSLDLKAERLDARQLVTPLHTTRLSGSLSASLADAQQNLKLDLRDNTFRMLADANLAEQRLNLPRLMLSAGDTRLEMHGQLDLVAPRQFALEGALHDFDPSRFGKLPEARLNARIAASGHLLPQLVMDTGFTLSESRIAGQAVTGRGQVAIAWPRIPKADVELLAGNNRLIAQGAYGQADERIKIDIDAQQLAQFGLEGGLRSHWEIFGASSTPRLSGSLQADRLGWPGHGRLNGLTLAAAFGTDANAPLQLDLSVANIDLPNQPGLLRELRIQGNGSNQAHRLTAQVDIAGKNHLVLGTEGGWNSATTTWRGQIAEARLQSKDPARNFQLLAPAPLTLATSGWQLGPLSLKGQPLDWQASLQAKADTQQLTATLNAHGSRIGQVDGQLLAPLQGPWSLDSDTRWQGSLRTGIKDLGWLAEVLGEGWESEGQLNGELLLSGTPRTPLINGRLRGDKLALRLPAQGLNLAQGELDIDLRDNLLHINRLGFDSLLQPMPRPLRLEARNSPSLFDAKPGRLEVTGEMRIDRGEGQESAWLDVRLDRLGAFQLPDQWIAVSGNGRLSWESGTLGAQGKLSVDAGYWQLAKGDTPRLSDDVVIKRTVSDKAPAPVRPKLNLDISTDLGNNFLFSGAGLSSRLVGDVRITAQGRDLPRASGRIRTRSGRFDAYGQKLEIERGVLTFNGLLDNPALDVRAVRKGLAVEPGVQISGTARKPVVKLVSDPELPDAEKLAWLVLGHGSEQMGAGDATTLLSAASGLLGNDSGNVVQQVKKTFGFDELGLRQGSIGDTGSRQQTSRVAGGTVDTTGSTGQQIFSVGKRLSSNALLSYEQTLGKAEGVVKLTVNLTRQISVIGRAGSDNALDLFYTLTFGRNNEREASDSR